MNEKKLKNRKAWLKQAYSLTIEDYNAMVTSQNGCGICHKVYKQKVYRVDHDHNTGKVRGLLCSGCNKRLGWAEKRQTFTLRQRAYLQA